MIMFGFFYPVFAAWLDAHLGPILSVEIPLILVNIAHKEELQQKRAWKVHWMEVNKLKTGYSQKAGGFYFHTCS